MRDDPIADFVMSHGECGSIELKCTLDVVALRCGLCGAVQIVTTAEHPEAVAATFELLDVAAGANLSAVARRVLADPRSTTEDVRQVLSDYPALLQALDKVNERQRRSAVVH